MVISLPALEICSDNKYLVQGCHQEGLTDTKDELKHMVLTTGNTVLTTGDSAAEKTWHVAVRLSQAEDNCVACVLPLLRKGRKSL